MFSQVESNRLESLSLLIEPTREEAQERNTLRKHVGKQASIALDNDPDPDGEAARLHMNWVELHKETKRKNERSCAIAERMYAKRSQELNSVGLSR